MLRKTKALNIRLMNGEAERLEKFAKANPKTSYREIFLKGLERLEKEG